MLSVKGAADDWSQFEGHDDAIVDRQIKPLCAAILREERPG